jgi:hypothetical protein
MTVRAGSDTEWGKVVSISINGVAVEPPDGAVAYKHADPAADAYWVYTEERAREIEAEAPQLIVWVNRLAP